jgi:hypothetical protein
MTDATTATPTDVTPACMIGTTGSDERHLLPTAPPGGDRDSVGRPSAPRRKGPTMPTAQTRPGTSPKQSELLDRTRESIIALHAQHPDDVPDPQTAIRLVGETLRATPLRTQKTAGAIKIVGWAMTYLRACRPGGHELIEGAGPLAPHLLWREAGTGVEPAPLTRRDRRPSPAAA